ncbi:hypothetical protein TNCV_704481 [Trichonephila clavipes]|nr:hypothetical protein TNCV_704481 [Trichonephila clavipes]
MFVERGGRGSVGGVEWDICISARLSLKHVVIEATEQHLPWRRISRTVCRWLQCNVPFIVTSIFLHEKSRAPPDRKSVLM